jgi:hypothetical protein
MEVTRYDPLALKELHERACTHFLELLDEKGKAPRLHVLVRSLQEAHPGDYPEKAAVRRQLQLPEFEQMLRERRREHLLMSLAPQMLMAEMGAALGRQASEELLDRLNDPERRAEMDTRDLVAVTKMAAELTDKVKGKLDEAAAESQVNRGTIVNLFTQLPPERAAAVVQEMVRRQLAAQRSGEDG